MFNAVGKKILIFAPNFFGYDKAIKKELEKMGAIVHLYDERPRPSSLEKILIRKARCLVKHKIRNYYSHIVNKEKLFKPDFILFINSEAVSRGEISLLKKEFPHAKLLLYMWDSTKNKKIKQYFGHFDRLYSFDLEDCKKYGMEFRPLFFVPAFENNKRSNESSTDKQLTTVGIPQCLDGMYDISFVGTIHSDRAKILLNLISFCDINNISYFIYLYVPGKLMYCLRWLMEPSFRKIEKKYIHIKPMKMEEFAKVSACSRCVLDINHPKQTGLTMRTIEMLGLCKKIITTNSKIRHYDFYVPSNQIIISRNEISIDRENLYKEYIHMDDCLYDKYSIHGWIKDIFNV
ncbi:MAG: hypothetical protein IKL51_01740 [Lachnospiraceae bacterium]|nr:hypothetical protein [Lachnospiraceae bacterium]